RRPPAPRPVSQKQPPTGRLRPPGWRSTCARRAAPGVWRTGSEMAGVSAVSGKVADALLAQLLADVDGGREELAGLLAELVRFPSVNDGDGDPGLDGVPNGNETPCATFLRDRLRAEGIAAEVFE